MFFWRSVSESGREHVSFSFANNGSLYLINECLQPIATEINNDATPQIVKTPLMLNMRMVSGVCRFLF